MYLGHIFTFIASLFHFKTERNLWANREAICESQLAEADQALPYCFRAVPWSLTAPILVLCVPKANIMFAPFFSDSQVD